MSTKKGWKGVNKKDNKRRNKRLYYTKDKKKSEDRDNTKGTKAPRGDKRLYYTKTKDKKRVKIRTKRGGGKRLYKKTNGEKEQQNKVKERHEQTTTKDISKKPCVRVRVRVRSVRRVGVRVGVRVRVKG